MYVCVFVCKHALCGCMYIINTLHRLIDNITITITTASIANPINNATVPIMAPSNLQDMSNYLYNTLHTHPSFGSSNRKLTMTTILIGPLGTNSLVLLCSASQPLMDARVVTIQTITKKKPSIRVSIKVHT